MQDVSVLVIDSDAHAGASLLQDLQQHGFTRSEHVASGLPVPAAAARGQPDIVLFHLHPDRPDELLSCMTAKLAAPHTRVVGIAPAGPGVKLLRAWQAEHHGIERILAKPLPPGALLAALTEIGEDQVAQRQVRERAATLASLLPMGAVQALNGGALGEDEMFEAAVLFTDVRHSSELITSQPARAYFRALNESLSAQSMIVRSFEGAVVKYTGDGMLAIFRGAGRSYLAARCAKALVASALQEPLGFGVGVAEGLVLAGLVGDFAGSGQHRQYDVIGATVHLAARLCAQESAGRARVTREVLRASRLALDAEDVGPVSVRGFASPVDCVTFGAEPARAKAGAG
jgi:adenylate cyclase